jgi:hypothetical protein
LLKPLAQRCITQSLDNGGKRVANTFGLDFNFMKAVGKIESEFNPKQRTGSYIGLFQLSNAEFQQYGSGDILDSRDNAVAATYKFLTEAILFEISTHKKLTLSDIYLIHQQGVQGAAEHVSHPDRLLGNQCVPPMKAERKVRAGVSELFGAIHFRQSNTSEKPLITSLRLLLLVCGNSAYLSSTRDILRQELIHTVRSSDKDDSCRSAAAA